MDDTSVIGAFSDQSVEGPGPFERTLPDDCVEYMLFIIDGQLDSRKLLSSLECVRKAAMHLADQLTKDYIWQRDCFSLETKSEKGTPFHPLDSGMASYLEPCLLP
jgi:hypothetical protein